MSGRSNPFAARMAIRVAPVVLGGLLGVLGCDGSSSGDGASPIDAAEQATASLPFFDQDGFRVTMETAVDRFENRFPDVKEHEAVDLTFEVREAREGGEALGGLRPLAWLVRRKEGEPLPDRETCKTEIRSLLAGRLARNADVNLNEYYVVTLDSNNSLSIIDPQIESSKTKTVGLITLPAWGSDLLLLPDRENVLVSLPTVSKVGIANLRKRRAQYRATPGRPRRVALQTDGRLAWIGMEGEGKVAVLDTVSLEMKAELDLGPGPHELAFDDESRRVFVASPASPRLGVADMDALRELPAVELEAPAIDVAFSPASRQVYALLDTGALCVIDARSGSVSTVIDLDPGTATVDVSPDGRWVFTMVPERNELVLIEDATRRKAFTVETEPGPYRVELTEAFAYVFHRSSTLAVLIDLHALWSERKVVATTVVLGQAPDEMEADGRLSPLMAPLPEGGGALVLSTTDRTIYHYMEGMSAPMGSYQTFPWPARGILIVDKTLQEEEKGRYSTDFRAPRGGDYTVAFLVSSNPQLFGCFDLPVQHLIPQSATPSGVSLVLEPSFAKGELVAGSPCTLGVRVLDGGSGDPVADVEDLMLLVFRGPTWEWRGAARPVGDGRYEVDVTFPAGGTYMVMYASRSRSIGFGRGRSLRAVVAAPAETPAEEREAP